MHEGNYMSPGIIKPGLDCLPNRTVSNSDNVVGVLILLEKVDLPEHGKSQNR